MKRSIATLITLAALVAVVLTSCGPAATPAPAVPATVPAAQPAATSVPAVQAAPTQMLNPTEPSAAPAASSGEKTTIRWGIYADPGRQAAAEVQVKAFNAKSPDVTVNIEQAPFAQYYDKMGAQIVSGQLYDVFMMSGANFQNYAPKGAFEDLTPYMQAAGIKLDDYYYEDEATLWDGKVLCLPYELDIQALYYNKELFDKSGVAYPTDSWTWSDLLEAAKKLTIVGADGKTQQWGFYSENLYPSYTSFIAQNGGSVLSEDKKTCTLDQPAAQEGIQFMVDLVQKYKVSPMPGELPAGVNPFQTGKVAMRIDGSYSVNPNLKMPFKWGLAPLPIGKQRAVAYWTQALCMFSKSPNKDAAWSFINYLMSDEGQAGMAQTKFSTPSKKSVAASQTYLTPPPDNIDVFVKSYENKKPIQFTATWFQIMSGGTSVIARNLDPVWQGKATVADATKSACTEINKILAGQ